MAIWRSKYHLYGMPGTRSQPGEAAMGSNTQGKPADRNLKSLVKISMNLVKTAAQNRVVSKEECKKFH